MFLVFNFVVRLVGFTLTVLHVTRKDWILSWQKIKNKKTQAPNTQMICSGTLTLSVPIWKYNFFLSGSFWK